MTPETLEAYLTALRKAGAVSAIVKVSGLDLQVVFAPAVGETFPPLPGQDWSTPLESSPTHLDDFRAFEPDQE